MLSDIFTDRLFLVIVFTGLGAQVLKSIVFLIKYKSIHLYDAVTTGGMPSSHSALMAGLSTAIFLKEGATTAFFLAVAILSIIVVDALGVRRTAGEEGKLLHQVLQKVKLRVKEPHYSLGHTPSEVFVGIVYGILVGLLVFRVW